MKKGYKLSEETKKKMSLAHTGKTLSEETRKKISLKLKGVKRSEETKQKMSFAHIGNLKYLRYKHTEETKEKIRKNVKIAMNRIEIKEKLKIAAANQEKSYQSKPERFILLYLNNTNKIYDCGQVKEITAGTEYENHHFDAVLRNEKKIIEVNGIYPHGHKNYFPNLNKEQMKNVTRDDFLDKCAKEKGWTIIWLWDVDFLKDLKRCIPKDWFTPEFLAKLIDDPYRQDLINITLQRKL